MVDWLPAGMQRVVLLLPMVHGVELVREGFFGHAVHTHHDMAYMASINLALTVFGLLLLRDASRRAGSDCRHSSCMGSASTTTPGKGHAASWTM
jgi:capsular polysaccharide transport system permease protein